MFLKYSLNPSLNKHSKGDHSLGGASLGAAMWTCAVSGIMRQWACHLMSGEWMFTPSYIARTKGIISDHRGIASGGIFVPGVPLLSQTSGPSLGFVITALLWLCVFVACLWYPPLGVYYCMFVVHCMFLAYCIWPVPVHGITTQHSFAWMLFPSFALLLTLYWVAIFWLCVGICCPYVVFCPIFTVALT